MRIDPQGYAEVKRMYVDPARRGHGIAGLLMAALEDAARAEGIGLLKLEMGELQREAVAFYRRSGFTPCAAFADYPENGASVFLEKRL